MRGCASKYCCFGTHPVQTTRSQHEMSKASGVKNSNCASCDDTIFSREAPVQSGNRHYGSWMAFVTNQHEAFFTNTLTESKSKAEDFFPISPSPPFECNIDGNSCREFPLVDISSIVSRLSQLSPISPLSLRSQAIIDKIMPMPSMLYLVLMFLIGTTSSPFIHFLCSWKFR